MIITVTMKITQQLPAAAMYCRMAERPVQPISSSFLAASSSTDCIV